MTDVIHNPPQHRFELEVDGHTAISEYTRDDDVITFIHTEVPKTLAGRGVGSRLIKGALDQTRTLGLRVVARCPFVRGYLEKHPEYANLVLQQQNAAAPQDHV